MRSHAKASSVGSSMCQVKGLFHIVRGVSATLAISALALLALAPSASAVVTRSYQSSFGTFAGANPEAVAVDQESGDVYAIDINNGFVDRFKPDGTPDNFTAGPDVGTNTLGGTSPFGFEGSFTANQVAIDNSGGPADGDIYVTQGFGPSSIKVFDSSGAPLTTLTGTGTDAGGFVTEPCGVAVDQSNGDLYIADMGNRIWRYSPSSGTVAEADYSGGIDPGFSPCQIAADDGHVWAVDWGTNSGLGGELAKFNASDFALGTPPAPSSKQIDANATAVAVDPSTGDVYSDEGSKISVFHASGDHFYDFGSEADFGATSPGVAVKANGPAYVADRHTGGKQVDVYGAEVYGHELAVKKSGPGAGTVTSSPIGINCGGVCSTLFGDGTLVTLTPVADTGSKFTGWVGCDSVVGEECKVTVAADTEVTATFNTKPAISGTSATPQGPTSAILSAQLNPGGDATTYHFEYGTAGPCDANPCTSTPTQNAGSGSIAVPVSRSLSGLAPGTTYHFRLVAANDIGTTESVDATFTTYLAPPSFEPCPNDALRSGPSAKLSDCRAYEQVSPIDKNGGDVIGDLFKTQASISGDAVTFGSDVGLPGAFGSQEIGLYMARRGADGWSTRGLLLPPEYADRGSVQGWTPDLAYSINNGIRAGAPDQSVAFFAASLSGDSFQPPAQITPYTLNASSISFVGASADDSKLFFEQEGTPLAPGAVAGKDNLYLYDQDNGQVSLVGVLPDSACTHPPCIPSGGSFAGPYDWWSGPLTAGGAANDGGFGYFTQDQHTISDDGDKAFFTSGGNGQIYMRQGLDTASPSTVNVSASHKSNGLGTEGHDIYGPLPAQFQAATPDGEHAFFTSPEKLTDDATTGPEPTTLPAPSAIKSSDLEGGSIDNSLVPAEATSVAVGSGHIYWTDAAEGTIGAAESDGTNADSSLITGLSDPESITVFGSHIYWADPTAGAIGRANLDGSAADPTFIANAGAVRGIALEGSHLYWTRATGNSDGAIGRAELDGSENLVPGSANPSYLPLSSIPNQVSLFAGDPYGIAVQGGHIFFATRGDYIVRIDLDGSNGLQVHNFGTCQVMRQFAIDGSHVYWLAAGHRGNGCDDPSEIGRANLDGSAANGSFITGPAVDFAHGIAVDGSHVYWSVSPPKPTNPGRDLYRYDVEGTGSCNESGGCLTDLVPDSNDENGAEVQGVIGAGGSGSYVYFVANATLDSAEAGDCHRSGKGEFDYSGECNLYVSHGGSDTFIARLDSSGDLASDAANWQPSSRGGGEGGNSSNQKMARVSVNGETVVFRSQRQLTDYDNHGAPEFYRYNVEDGLTCVSCNPTGIGPNGRPQLRSIGPFFLHALGTAKVLTRSLSSDGNRFFFETPDKLVGADVNGDGGCPFDGALSADTCQDVYEWEAPGSGSCTQASSAYSSQDGGCIYLLSSGTSSSPSYLADASASGDDVFIFTHDQLVPQDQDTIQDVYDVRVNGGLTSQHASVPPPCAGEACRDLGTIAGDAQGAGSEAFSGTGNQAQSPPQNCNAAAKRAQKLTSSSKALRARARKAGDPATAKRLLQQSAALAKRADRLSHNAKRCRRANRRAAK